MEPVASIVSAISKVLQQIAKAEREARRNRARCRDLAERAKVVSNVLRDAKASAPSRKNDSSAAATRRMILCRLREALDDALKLIESCGGRGDGSCGFFGPWVNSLLNSAARATRFDDVDKRISNCLVELSVASGASIEKKIDRLSVASARDHHPGTKKQKEAKAGNAPQKGATGQGGQNGGKGAKRRKGKKKNAAAAGSRPPPPPPVACASVRFAQNGHSCTAYHHHYHSVEEDPNSCSVM